MASERKILNREQKFKLNLWVDANRAEFHNKEYNPKQLLARIKKELGFDVAAYTLSETFKAAGVKTKSTASSIISTLYAEVTELKKRVETLEELLIQKS